jgi:hypothetical protein
MQRRDVNVAVEYSNMKSETDKKSELGKAISISRAKPKSGQADTIFSLLKKEMSLYEATCTLTKYVSQDCRRPGEDLNRISRNYMLTVLPHELACLVLLQYENVQYQYLQSKDIPVTGCGGP